MIILIIIVLVGVLFSVFAAQNTQTADIFLSQLIIRDIPVFLIVLVSLLFGLFLAWLIHIIGDISNKMALREYKKELDKSENKIAQLTKEIHKLELENTEYRSKLGEEDFDEESIQS